MRMGNSQTALLCAAYTGSLISLSMGLYCVFFFNNGQKFKISNIKTSKQCTQVTH